MSIASTSLKYPKRTCIVGCRFIVFDRNSEYHFSDPIAQDLHKKSVEAFVHLVNFFCHESA